jgi:hypothetical protein
MQINVTWDTSVLTASAATQIESAVDYVVNLFDSLFTNPITINIDVGWGEVAGQSLVSNALGESITNTTNYNYSQIRNALTNTANDSGDPSQLAAASSLPATNPTNSNTFTIADAEAKALGLMPSGGTAVDGYVGFGSGVNWSFSPTATPTLSQYYFIGVAEHEISEVMGRFSDVGTGAYSLMDLFRYSAPETRDLANSRHGGGTTAYFSIDGGTSNLGTWNNVSRNGDLGDWAGSTHDAFNAATGPGVINNLSTNDTTLMNVLGYDVACFMPGTKIRTLDGEITVEMLSRGNLVTTADGRTLPITWIGRSSVSTLFADPLRVLPIRIRAGALGESVPSCDLLLSPDHALFFDGVLVQAGALVNGTSIMREHNVPERFTYYHIELDDHALILAENTPTETFIDNVDRMAFDNWQEYETLYPEHKPIVEMPYPRAKAHRQVPRAVRELLAKRAGNSIAEPRESAA